MGESAMSPWLFVIKIIVILAPFAVVGGMVATLPLIVLCFIISSQLRTFDTKEIMSIKLTPKTAEEWGIGRQWRFWYWSAIAGAVASALAVVVDFRDVPFLAAMAPGEVAWLDNLSLAASLEGALLWHGEERLALNVRVFTFASYIVTALGMALFWRLHQMPRQDWVDKIREDPNANHKKPLKFIAIIVGAVILLTLGAALPYGKPADFIHEAMRGAEGLRHDANRIRSHVPLAYHVYSPHFFMIYFWLLPTVVTFGVPFFVFLTKLMLCARAQPSNRSK